MSDLRTTDSLADLRRLTSSGRVPPPEEMARRARRWGWWYAAEHWLVESKAWAGSLLVYAIGTPFIYLVALGMGLGSLVAQGGDSGGGTVDGVEYLTFVAPALLVATVVMSVAGETTYPIMAGFTWERTYEGPHASPLSPHQIASGAHVWLVLRFTVQGALFLAMMWAFGALHSAWAWLSVPIAVLAALAMGTLIQAYTATVKTEGYQFAVIHRLIIMPMFLFSGTFFQLESLPAVLHLIGWISPIWHGTELARWATYGSELGVGQAAVHLGFLAACTALGVWLSRRNYARRLNA